ncbi:MAG TPA: ROK family protein [Solirubrobacteraceae bacterium]|nr:ROK family protein [Solirubrobacteraceae bacterium]
MAAGCVIGVDLGGTKLLGGVVDQDLTVHHRAHRWARGADEKQVLETLVAAVSELRDAADTPVAGVGFGIPSLIDHRRGRVMWTNHFPLYDLPFRDLMAERLGMPVWVDNDANVALLAEQRAGAAQGADEAVMLTLGTGIGGAIMARGEILHGTRGGAGELGHMVIDMNGPPCPCGNVGCLEALASGNALGREALRVAAEAPESGLGQALAAGREITGKLCTELAHDGDLAAREVVALIGRRLGIGIANIANILNPSVVVVGGGVIAAGDLLLEPAREELRRRANPPMAADARVEQARFGEESGMLGAALLALDGLAATAVA